jgi:hypothetical protein
MGMSDAPKSTTPLNKPADAAAGTDGLIVDSERRDARRCTREPLGVDGVWKRGARGGDFLGLSRAQRAHQKRNEQ